MNFSRYVIFAGCLLFAACGKDAPNGNVALTPQDAAAASPVKAGVVSVTEIEPTTPGESWSRKIQVNDPEPSFWTVEKDEGHGWRSAGFTDKDGVFIDPQASSTASYRVGSVVEVGPFEPLFDTVLNQDIAISGTCSAGQFTATRIFVPSTAKIRIEACPVRLSARVVHVDGLIYAYGPGEVAVTGAKTSKLTIEADRFEGAGSLNLAGRRGVDGTAGGVGPAGAAGKQNADNESQAHGGAGGSGGHGGDGTNGNDGGNVLLAVNTVSFDVANISVLPGLAGAAGPGGEGGAAGAAGTWLRPRIMDCPDYNRWCHPPKETVAGASGTAGGRGDDGLAGAAGIPGQVIKTNRP